MKFMKYLLFVFCALLASIGASMAQITNTPAGVTSVISSGASNAFDTGVSIFVAAMAVIVTIGYVLKGLRKGR